MNILAAMEKRPGLSHISWQHHDINYNQAHIKFSSALLNCDQIWCSLCHYITITPLHLWWYQGWSPWGRESDGILISDSDLILISHSSLTPSPGHHNLLITSQQRRRYHKFLRSIQNMSSLKRSLSCLFSLDTNTGRTNWCLKVSWITTERAGRGGDRDVIKITLDRSSNYTQFTRWGQASSLLQCYSVKALKMFPGHSLWPGIRWQSQSDQIRSSSESGFTKIILTLQI